MKKDAKLFALALYNERKATEVAAFFLLRATKVGSNISKLRLAKWMYLAERLAYQWFGEPITGDRMLSMKHGPVLSNTLYLMEERFPKAMKRIGLWEENVLVEHHDRHRYMKLSDKSAYRTIDDLRSLSDAEVDVLEEVWRLYGRLSASALEDLLHDPKHFPEWNWKSETGSGGENKSIELERLLPILGMDADNAAEVIGRLEELKHIEQSFSQTKG